MAVMITGGQRRGLYITMYCLQSISILLTSALISYILAVRIWRPAYVKFGSIRLILANMTANLAFCVVTLIFILHAVQNTGGAKTIMWFYLFFALLSPALTCSSAANIHFVLSGSLPLVSQRKEALLLYGIPLFYAALFATIPLACGRTGMKFAVGHPWFVPLYDPTTVSWVWAIYTAPLLLVVFVCALLALLTARKLRHSMHVMQRAAPVAPVEQHRRHSEVVRMIEHNPVVVGYTDNAPRRSSLPPILPMAAAPNPREDAIQAIHRATYRVIAYPLVPIVCQTAFIVLLGYTAKLETPPFSLLLIAVMMLSLQGALAAIVNFTFDPAIRRLRVQVRGELYLVYVRRYGSVEAMGLDMRVVYPHPRVARFIHRLVQARYSEDPSPVAGPITPGSSRRASVISDKIVEGGVKGGISTIPEIKEGDTPYSMADEESAV